jgi:hypothetical protein
LDPGNYDEFVQWETFRRSRSCVTNISQAGVYGLGESVGAFERREMWISQAVTHSFWFSRFMAGLPKRVGEIKKRDEAITIDVVHAIEDILHSKWRKTDDPKVKQRIAEMRVWFIGGFCIGLRGEEMLLIEFAGTSNSLKHMNDPLPHFLLVILGRTEGNQLSGSKFGIPCVSVTEGTHLRPGIWVARLVPLMKAEGVTGGITWQESSQCVTEQCQSVRPSVICVSSVLAFAHARSHSSETTTSHLFYNQQVGATIRLSATTRRAIPTLYRVLPTV